MKTTIKNLCLEFVTMQSGWTSKFRFLHLIPGVLIHRDVWYNHGGIILYWLYWGVEVKWSHLK